MVQHMPGLPAGGRASRLWQCCALLVLLCGSATAQFKDFRQKWNLTRQDVVVAMPVDKNHLTLAKGSRIWRRVRASPLVSLEITTNLRLRTGGNSVRPLCKPRHCA